MSKVLVAVWVVWVCLTAGAWAADSPGRVTKPIDFDWRFHLGDAAGAQEDSFVDSKWRSVDLPHDFGVEGEYSPKLPGQTGYLPGGIGWYRRVIDVPAEWKDKTVAIEFDAVCMNSTVWVHQPP
jgi:beta-galactosidase